MTNGDLVYLKMAQTMFDGYNNEGPNPWKTQDGKPVPRWNELTDQVRGKWIAAARSFVGLCKETALIHFKGNVIDKVIDGIEDRFNLPAIQNTDGSFSPSM